MKLNDEIFVVFIVGVLFGVGWGVALTLTILK